MDLAKNLAQWRDHSPEQWIAVANRYLPPIVVAVLILLLAFQAADLTWRLLDSPSEQDIVPVATQAPGGSSSATGPQPGSYEALTGWEPFGSAPEESTEAISADLLLDAPETTLNLTLNAAWQAQELPERGSMVIPERGVAVIISGRGEEKVYWTGDTIDNVGSTRLHSVFIDRVLLDRGGGRLETLRFPEDDNSQTPARNSRVAARPAIQSPQPIQSLNDATAVAESATRIAGVLGTHMSIAQHSENGQMIGFRVEPKGTGQVFSQLQLEAGDVLTDVNGVRLNNVLNINRVFQALAEAPQAQVTIRRNGQDQTVVMNIGDIMQLAESLQ